MAQQSCGASPAIFVQSNPNEGCYSYVGMIAQWQSQKLQLQYPGCATIGIAVHELGHALGMGHEQARPDRDNYVSINWGNIQAGMESNFAIQSKGFVGNSYDHISVMHYDAYAFAKVKTYPTIEFMSNPGHTASEIGNRMGVSNNDAQQLMAMYKDIVFGGCTSNWFSGKLGCIDKVSNSGSNICRSLSACTASSVSTCCGCGGGVKIQCYTGEPCPQPPSLPPPAGGNCIQDKTKEYGGNGCIISNICAFPVQWKCTALSCTHQTNPGGAFTNNCNGQQQTEICTNPSNCKVWKVSR